MASSRPCTNDLNGIHVNVHDKLSGNNLNSSHSSPYYFADGSAAVSDVGNSDFMLHQSLSDFTNDIRWMSRISYMDPADGAYCTPGLPRNPNNNSATCIFPTNEDSGYHTGPRQEPDLLGGHQIYGVSYPFPPQGQTSPYANSLLQPVSPDDVEQVMYPHLCSPIPMEAPMAGSQKRSRSNVPSENSNELIRPPKICCLASERLKVSKQDEDTMRDFLEEWTIRHHLPTEDDMKNMALQVDLSVHKCTLWVGANLRLAASASPSVSTPEPGDSSDGDKVKAHIRLYIDGYIEKHKNQECTKGRSDGRFSCTWGCGYACEKRDALEQHEETKQPQRFWVCHICDEESDDPYMTHRDDKILSHARTTHSNEDPKKLRQSSEVPYEAPFIKRCSYKLRNGHECNHRFTSWKERNDHFIAHYKDRSPKKLSRPITSKERLPHAADAEEHDNDDSHDEMTSPTDDPSKLIQQNLRTAKSSLTPSKLNARSAKPQKMPQQKLRSSSTSNQNSYNNRVEADLVCSPDYFTCGRATILMDTSESFSPIKLFDVDKFQLVDVESGSRYLALRHDHQGSRSLHSLLQTATGCNMSSLVHTLPPSVITAILLTREVGHKYLWIDSWLLTDDQIEAAYRRAVFILVIGQPQYLGAPAPHFFCDYHHMNGTTFWARGAPLLQSIRPLGQGACSLVDEVKLGYFDEDRQLNVAKVFARKIVLRGGSEGDKMRQSCLREIEVMRKFNHPHIAKFVAAYCSPHAFNILISPVAECDLRQFLIQPDRFSRLQQFLPQWFMCLAEALRHIHEQSCRHEDIKPANIIISGRSILLTDFGTSLDFANDLSSSVGDGWMTPKYCAPEVAYGKERGRSADIWSLGCVFAEMFAVLVDGSLEGLQSSVKIKHGSLNRSDTYHEQLCALDEWLSSLQRHAMSPFRRSILLATRRMLEPTASRRPTAMDVVSMLCKIKNCELCAMSAEQRSAWPCHCCRYPKYGTCDSDHKESLFVAEEQVKQVPHSLGIQVDGASCYLYQDNGRWSVHKFEDPEAKDLREMNPWTSLVGRTYIDCKDSLTTRRPEVKVVPSDPSTFWLTGYLGEKRIPIMAKPLDNLEPLLVDLELMSSKLLDSSMDVDSSALLYSMMEVEDEEDHELDPLILYMVRDWFHALPEISSGASAWWMVQSDKTEDFRRILPEQGDLTVLNKTLYRASRSMGASTEEDGGAEVRLPKRLVEIGGSEATLRLIETAGSRGHYVAVNLDIDFGNLTTRLTRKDMMREIPYDRCPAAFKDAVKLTRQLGYHYIWVEQLCIIQEDHDDQGKERQQLQHIHEQSAFTIVDFNAVGFQTRFHEDDLSVASSTATTPSIESESSDFPCDNISTSSSSPVAHNEHLPPRRLLYTAKWLYYQCESGFTIASRATANHDTLSIHSRRSRSVLEVVREYSLRNFSMF